MAIIETERLRLRPMRLSDVAEMILVFNDPKVMASLGVEPVSRSGIVDWLQRNLAHQDNYGYGLFSVILKSNGVLIGNCGLQRMGVDGKQMVELGYDFHSDYWNKGYATEAATAVRDFAFNELNLSELVSLVGVGNMASARVAEKVGMTRESEIMRDGRKFWKYSAVRKHVSQVRMRRS